MEDKILYRAATIGKDAIDADSRTVAVAFSSEQAYERSFGMEVLSHDPADVDLSFLASGNAPLLREHDTDSQIGVVESAAIENGVGRALVRFSKSEDGEEEFQDVMDGIRKNISVGYVITGHTVDKTTQPPTVRCQWRPMEISLVSIPADETVGVGRNNDVTAMVADDGEPNLLKETEMENTNTTPEMDTRSADIEVVRQEAQKLERSRVADINELATRHNVQNIGNEFIRNGKSVDEFRAAVLETLANRPAVQASAEIGMSAKEVKQFSLGRAAKAMVTGDWSEAGFELEASRAAAKQSGRVQTQHNLIVPADYLSRAAVTVAGNGALVGTDHLGGSFMDVLFNNSIAAALGVTYMNGLNGDVEIPKFTSKVTAYEVAEGVDVTGSKPDSGTVTLSPRTIGALVEFTRKMALQSDPFVESILRAHIQKAMGEKIDQMVFDAVLADASINWESMATATYAKIKKIISKVEIANALNAGCKWALNPNSSYTLETTLKDTNTAGIYLKDGASVAGYGALVSNNVPLVATKGSGVFGDWGSVAVGNWGTLELAVDTSQKFASGGFLMRALADLDVAVLRDEAFSGFKDLGV